MNTSWRLHFFIMTMATLAVVHGQQHFSTKNRGTFPVSYPRTPYYTGVNMSTAFVEPSVNFQPDNDEAEPCQVTSDFVFVIDASSSVGEQNFRMSLNFTADMIRALLQKSDSRAGIVTFAEIARPILRLDDDKTSDELDELVCEAEYYNSTSTNSYWGLWRAIIQFDTYNRSANQILLFITNGPSDDEYRLEQKAKEAQEKGIKSFALGIGPLVSDAELNIIAANIQDRIFKIESYQDLKKYAGHVSRELCVE